MTNQPAVEPGTALPPFDGVEEAQMVADRVPGKVSQFRLYRDANLLIPIAKVSKTKFVHDAVMAAANDPARLGWALIHRGTRVPQAAEQQARISISTSVSFQENVEALAVTYRMTNEEVVRLAVEAAVYKAVVTRGAAEPAMA
jgi:hypothetical protein